jgi:polyisoprenoid-binding protein YceI
LQVKSEVMVEGKANVGGFKCFTSPLTPKDPLPSCFLKTQNEIEITGVRFNIPIDGFDCGNPLISNDLESVLDADHYPYIVFQLNQLKAQNLGAFYKGSAKATTTVKGVKHDITIPIEVDQIGPKEYRISGQTIIKLSWYNIEQPSRLFGLLTLEDEVSVCFELYFTKSI